MDIPPAPSNVLVNSGPGVVSLAWTNPISNSAPIIGTRIEYSRDGSTWTQYGDLAPSVAGAVLTGLTNAVPYQFRITSLYPDNGTVALGERVVVSATPYAPLAPPANAMPTSASGSDPYYTAVNNDAPIYWLRLQSGSTNKIGRAHV